MLVLERKLGERIHVGEDVEVVVLKICGARVQLGFAAPREVRIRRGELADRLNSTVQADGELRKAEYTPG